MRKIMNFEEQRLREKRKIRILSIFMLIILLGSTAGFAFISYQQDSLPQTPETVQDTGNGWTLNWQGQTFSLRTSPSAVADIPVQTTSTIDTYMGDILYVDAESDAILAEIGSTMGRYAQRVQPACYGLCERDLPEVNCSANIIIWKSAEENSVSQEEGCVFIDGDIRSVDAFIYRVLGVQ